MPLLSFERDIPRSTVSHWKLKPWGAVFKDKDHGWSPLLWVAYLGFFFIDPVLANASQRIWFFDIAGAIVFLVLYFGLFALENPSVFVHIGGMVLLGMLFLPINSGACTFFIYAAAMVPFCVDTKKAAILGLAIVGTMGAVEGLWLHINRWTLFYSSIFPLLIGAGNTFFAERNRMNRRLRRANEEIEHLAK